MVMHDMWPVTGGCHHSFDCVKYRSKCINCPMFGENGILQWPTRGFEKKKNLYSEFKNLYFVSPSQWLYKCAKESFLTNDKPIFHIPNITDQNLYKHVNRKMARQFLNLSENEYIVGFGAFELSSPYKGWTELQKALRILAEFKFEKDISVLIFGGNTNKEIADAIPFRTRFMGFLSDGYSTALVYNAIDVFIAPSLADNLPTAILESEACETPVVGFDVGGIPEIIAHKKNGYLAKYRDPEDLAKGIHYCYENEVHGYLLPEFGKNEIMMKHRTMLENIDKGIYS
jgi:glycosyltransferase involved in cell wall biosynthesis